MRTWYSTDQEAIDGAFGAFFAAESPIEAVRTAAPTGFDPRLWASLAAMGGAGMALPEPQGGGAGLADLAVVARQLGRHLAPVPLIEHSVACRLLAAVATESDPGPDLTAWMQDGAALAVESAPGSDPSESGPATPGTTEPAASTRGPGSDLSESRAAESGVGTEPKPGTNLESLLGELTGGETIATLTLRPVADRRARLVPAGAVAGAVVGFDGTDLVLDLSEPSAKTAPNTADLPLADRSTASAPSISGTVVPNTADLPLADRDLTGAAVIASGPAAARLWAAARAEWQALMAVACSGLAARAVEIGVDYVMGRRQFGVPVGSFQAVQHGLADAAVRTEGGRLLAHRAAWALDAGRPDGRRLAAMALVFCAEAARFAADRSLQYHGGYGYSAEYDVQLYYRRAAGWPLQIGEPAGLLAELADIDLGPRAAAGTEAERETVGAAGAEAEREAGSATGAPAASAAVDVSRDGGI